MAQFNLGTGIGIAVLIGLVAYLFGLDFAASIALILLLAGIWTVVFGLFFASPDSRLYFSGWGVVIAIIASFEVIPLNYSLAFILIAIIIMIIISAVSGSKRTKK